MSTRTAAAWRSLNDALADADPACRNDARFTAESTTAADLDGMRELCAFCPIFAACATYASAAPGWTMSGFWAGAKRGQNTRADYQRREGAA
jgi:hypothetical protein